MFMNIFAFVYAVLYHFEHKKPNNPTSSLNFPLKTLNFPCRVREFRRRRQKRRENLKNSCFYYKFIDFLQKTRKLTYFLLDFPINAGKPRVKPLFFAIFTRFLALLSRNSQKPRISRTFSPFFREFLEKATKTKEFPKKKPRNSKKTSNFERKTRDFFRIIKKLRAQNANLRGNLKELNERLNVILAKQRKEPTKEQKTEENPKENEGFY